MTKTCALETSNQGRRHCTRQQDCSHGLGNDDAGRALQRTRRAGGVKEIAPGIRRDVNGWEEQTARNAEPVDPAIRTTHLGQSIVERVVLTGT